MKKTLLFLSALFILGGLCTFFIFKNVDVAIALSVSGTICSFVSFFVKNKVTHEDFKNPEMGTANKSANDR